MLSDMQKRQALALVVQAVVETVTEMGRDGAPGGVLYAALMGKLTLHQFEVLMSALVDCGKLTKRGQLYFATPARLHS